eukprot:CAMPEP_0206546626 /NCGR_PEP_ID=MMETSP0325_2-20121206/12822_1 /ASSEMBLY_ACC=CAM_ASM_000347 /TAXON_ID=2866 /ORGANISM="Crypthecodinium cohnii, Strain Seligo" /LENGTH=630 /DNA_ID=CAMNT_0054045795 /DNA_START=549 /DNA_END=2443 /DNA_ORIENTATION=-
MWACCQVEREASTSSMDSRVLDPSPPSSVVPFNPTGQCAGHVGIGLMARQEQPPERPLASANNPEVPNAHGVEMLGMWKPGVEQSSNTSSTMSSTPVNSGAAVGWLQHPQMPRQPNQALAMDDNGNSTTTFLESPPFYAGTTSNYGSSCGKDINNFASLTSMNSVVAHMNSGSNPSHPSSSQFASLNSQVSAAQYKSIDTFKSNMSKTSSMFRSRSSRLLIEDEQDDEPEFGHTSSNASRSPLQRRKSLKTIIERNKSSENHAAAEEDKANPRKFIRTFANQVNALFGRKAPPPRGDEDAEETAPPNLHPPALPTVQEDAPEPPKARPKASARRNSQYAYAHSAQTAIVFDWDDTLFPTSYLIDDLRLNHKKGLGAAVTEDLYEELAESLKELERSVVNLLKLANAKGKVILVTLARHPWVEDSCRSFYGQVGALIQQLGIKVVYAQQGIQVDYDKRRMMSDEEIEHFYASMKGQAISREVEAFYSQYEGQSWKNIISIGDSDFERVGTMMMAQEYMKKCGLLANNGEGFEVMVASNEAFARNTGTIHVNGQVFKVRLKTFKMLDCPTIGELKEEIILMQRWLPKMVELDDGFDADLSALDDPRLVDQIESVLSGGRRANSKSKHWHSPR